MLGKDVDSEEFWTAGYGRMGENGDEAEETSTQASRRVRQKGYYHICHGPHTEPLRNVNYYKSILPKYFRAQSLRQICSNLKLPSSSVKYMVESIATTLDQLDNQGALEEYNAAVRIINRAERIMESRDCLGRSGRSLIKEKIRKEALEKMFRRSLDLKYEPILPEGYKLVRKLSEPVFLPFVPESAYDHLVIPFQYYPVDNSDESSRQQSIILLTASLKIDSSELVNGERVSWTSRLTRVVLNGSTLKRKTHFKTDDGAFPRWQLQDVYPGDHKLRLEVRHRHQKPYYFQVILISHERAGTLVRTSEQVKQLYTNLMQNPSLDEDAANIDASTIQLSLRCPLSLVRMKTPVRLDSCKHLQCIDLNSWIAHNNQRIRCLICGNTSGSLIYDGFTKDIITATSPLIETVQVNIDDNFSWNYDLREMSIPNDGEALDIDEDDVDLIHTIVDLTEAEDNCPSEYDPWLHLPRPKKNKC